jgi:hypothetical protein
VTVAPARWTPWRFVTAFGIISLLADLVYEGARSVTGPYLATLGASATVVGVVTGVGEAFALVGRLGNGSLADRTRAYWPLVLVEHAQKGRARVPAAPALFPACGNRAVASGGLCWRTPKLTGRAGGQRLAWKASTIELGIRPRSDTS